MKLETTFTAFGELFTATFDTDIFDRNYDDENYAYWIMENKGRYFEVNIWKDYNDAFTDRGTVYAFSNIGDFEDGDWYDEIDIVFTKI